MTAGTSGDSTLAVIPARGGSKRIPRKNIRAFAGVPLLARTIDLLRSAGVFDRIIVSTDDEEIVQVALSAGAEVPFRRPPELSGDRVITAPVIEHAIQSMDGLGSMASFVCCVYPGAAIASVADIRAGLEKLCSSDFDYVFAGTSFPYPIQRALRFLPDGGCAMFWPEHKETLSQDLEHAYHDAGQFYWGTRAAWLEHRPVFSPRSHLLVVPRYRVQDIDTPEDWERAEMIFQFIQQERERK
ncbi:MAG: pseudaminic acid cytidylyltransferase [Gammaproteobacteria bacterium]